MQLMLIAWCEQAFNLNDEKGIEDAMSFLLGESENPIEKIYTKAFQHQKDGEEEEAEKGYKEVLEKEKDEGSQFFKDSLLRSL